jgi:hypothetical protein
VAGPSPYAPAASWGCCFFLSLSRGCFLSLSTRMRSQASCLPCLLAQQAVMLARLPGFLLLEWIILCLMCGYGAAAHTLAAHTHTQWLLLTPLCHIRPHTMHTYLDNPSNITVEPHAAGAAKFGLESFTALPACDGCSFWCVLNCSASLCDPATSLLSLQLSSGSLY